MKADTKFHRDGTITYWSVYEQRWHKHAGAATVPDQELAAMNDAERRKILAWAATDEEYIDEDDYYPES